MNQGKGVAVERFEKDGVVWLEFRLLQPYSELQHAIFLRHGGVSGSPFDSLNAGLEVGDSEGCVRENLHRMRIARALPECWAMGKGVHGVRVVEPRVHNGFQIIPDCDGLISAVPGQVLMMTHADCQVALMYDPVHRAIGNVHAGWRGSVQNIYAEAILAMHNAFGTQPKDLLVCLSPSLGPAHAEFKHFRDELPREFWKFQTAPGYFDFWEISRHQLEEAGVLPGHVECAKICTYATPSDYFSFRRDQRITGRHAACVALRAPVGAADQCRIP